MVSNPKNAVCLLLLAGSLLLTACTPSRIQTAEIVDDHDGRPIYEMTGYTGAGESASNDSVQYIQYALKKACPDGIRIISLTEQPAHNGCCQFLSWKAQAECN